MLFPDVLRWSYDLNPLFYSDVIHVSTVVYYVYWFAYVGSSLCSKDKAHLMTVYEPAEFSLLVFYWKFDVYIHQGYWPVVFFSCSVLVWLWYQGNVGLLKCVWKCFLFVLHEFETVLVFLFWGFWSLSLIVIGLFRFSTHDSRDLSISSKLSNLLAYDCHDISHDPLFLWYLLIPISFIILFTWTLFFSLVSLDKGLPIWFIFFWRTNSIFCCFPVLYFIYLCSNLYCFLKKLYLLLRLGLVLTFLLFWGVILGCLFEIFLYSWCMHL